jgi:hypothetical protein
MRKKIDIDRLISLVMAVAMILSLITFDNRFGTKAKDELEGEVINLEEYVPDDISYEENKDGTVDIDSVDETVITVSGEKEVSFKGDYLMQDITDGEAEEIATSCDAEDISKNAPQPAEKIDSIVVDEEHSEYVYAVYKVVTEEEYEFAAIISVLSENTAEVPQPVITDVQVTTNSNVVETEDYVYAKSEEAVNVAVDVDFGETATPGEAVYIKENDAEKSMDGADGKYTASFNEGGTYTFKAYSYGETSADRKVSESVTKTIKYVSAINTPEVSVDEASKTAGKGIIAELLNSTEKTITVTITATREDGTLDAPLELYYELTLGDTPVQKAVDMDVVNGVYTAAIEVPKATVEKSAYNLKVQVRDKVFVDINSDAVNTAGAKVFIDDNAPDVSVSSIKLGTTTYSTIADYNKLSDDSKWSKNIQYSVAVDEDYSYISKVIENDGTKDTTLYDAGSAYEYSKDINLSDIPDGKYTFTYTAENKVGLKGSAVINVYKDATAPDISINSSSIDGEVEDDADYPVTSKTGETLTISFSDSTSGIASQSVKVNGEKAVLTDNSITFDSIGMYEVVAEATDKAGNTTTKKCKVTVDNETAETSLTAECTKDNKTIQLDTSKTVYSNGSIQVVYTASGYGLTEKDVVDSTVFTAKSSEVENITPVYKVTTVDADKQINKVTVTYSIDKEGSYTFDFKTKNHFADSVTTESETFKLVYDITFPYTTTAKLEGDSVNIGDTYYFAEKPVLYMEAEDDCALDSYEVLDGDGNVILKDTLSSDSSSLEDKATVKKTLSDLPNNKECKIVIHLSDKAGNVQNIELPQVVVDTQKASVSIENVDENGKLSSYWNNSAVTFKVNATDNYYVKYFEAVGTRDGKAVDTQTKSVDYSQSAVTTFKYSAEGVYNIKVYAYDEVGNKSKVETCSFVIDKKKSVVTFTGIPDDKTMLYDQTPISVEISDEYGINKKDVVVIEHYETYDGTEGIRVVKSVQKGDKKVTASVKSCTIIDNKAMKYYFTVDYTDKAGNNGTYTTDVFYYDATEPDVKITPNLAGKGTVYYNETASFNINVTEQFPLGADIYVLNYSDYTKYSIDEYPEKAIKSFTLGDKTSDTFKISASKEGKYSWVVVALDTAGNEADSAKIRFNIDKTNPEIEVTGVPESGLSQGTDVVFKITDNYKILASDVSIVKHYTYYNGTKDYSVKVPVKTDEDGNLTATTHCNEVDGKAVEYYFVVTGHDYAGNKLTFSTNKYRFKVDNTKPKVSIDPVPVDTNDGYYNDKVSFKVNVKEQFNEKHKIKIVDRNKAVNGDEDTSITIKGTDGVYTVSRSSQGIYDFDVTVTDAFGNETTERVGFTIDKTLPVIKIASVNQLNNSNVGLNVEISDNYRGKSYNVHVVRKDAGGNVVYDNDFKKAVWETTSVVPDLVFTEEGDYTVTVSADDKAGNKSENSMVSFRIDKTAPVLSITGVNDTQTSDCTATLSVNEAFTFAFDGSSTEATDITATITKKTDGSGTTNIATLNTGNFSSGNPHTATYTFSEDGEYTITFNAKDICGNTAAAVTKTFKVDKTAPVLQVSAVDSKNSNVTEYQLIGGGKENENNYVDMNISVTEAFFTTNNVNISVSKNGEDVSSGYFTNYGNRGEVSTGSQRFEEDGVYTVSIESEDALGNKAEGYSMVFTIDNTAPVVEATDKKQTFAGREDANGDILLNSDDFADIADKGYEALWNVSDTSVFTVSAKLDGVDFVDFSDLSDGYHKLDISVTDEAGYTSTDSFEFTYDGTAPRILITGVEDNEVVKEPFKLTIGLEDEDDTITKLVINGEEIDSSLYKDTNTYEYQVDEYGSYEILVTATDIAGNVSSTYDSETGAVFSFVLREKMSPTLIIVIILIILILVALLLVVIIKRKKKDKK